MCGIFGFFSKSEEKSIDTILEESFSTISYRGPDYTDRYIFKNLRLFHHRLSILDLDNRSNQPFHSSCGNYVLIFNGEIYNYKYIRKELINLGLDFNTTSDTEVLLNGFIYWGEKILKKIEGMYSFVILDKKKMEIFGYRDPFGIKPLFYCMNDSFFGFSSEQIQLADLKKRLHDDLTTNKSSICEYLMYGYVPNPGTFYSQINSLPPGSKFNFKLDYNELLIEKWFNFDLFLTNSNLPKNSSLKAFENNLKNNVALHLESDVPIAIMLSGGIDSSLIAKYASEKTRNIKAFTLNVVNDPNKSELKYAKKISKELNLELEIVDFDFKNSNISQLIRNSLSLMDAPFANSTNIFQAEICKKISEENMKVVLVGDGADEIFMGYPRYLPIYIKNYFNKIPFIYSVFKVINFLSSIFPEKPGFNHFVRRTRIFTEIIGKPIHEIYAVPNTFIDLSDQLSQIEFRYDLLQNIYKNSFSNNKDPLLSTVISDLSSFVPYNLLLSNDLVGSKYSLEIRVPFLSTLSLSNTNPNKDIALFNSKKRLRKLASIYWGKKFAYRSKRGFNPPIWALINNNEEFVRENLLKKNNLHTFISKGLILKLIENQFSYTRDNSRQIWALLLLNDWIKLNSLLI